MESWTEELELLNYGSRMSVYTILSVQAVSNDAWSLRPRRCPKYLDQTVQLAASVTRRQRLRSSASADLRYVVPTTRTKLGELAFSVAGPTLWN